MEATRTGASPKLPRVAITYCTQCKWMLRAAWFGQELLSTFGTSIGEIALIPATGGVFTVHLSYIASPAHDQVSTLPNEVLIWDRKRDGGFPEAKILKQLIRNHIDPDKNLGHSDTPSSKAKETAISNGSGGKLEASSQQDRPQENSNSEVKEMPCEDCK